MSAGQAGSFKLVPQLPGSPFRLRDKDRGALGKLQGIYAIQPFDNYRYARTIDEAATPADILLPDLFDIGERHAQLNRIPFKSKSMLIKAEAAEIVGILERRAEASA
jgi:hypothetical protein